MSTFPETDSMSTGAVNGTPARDQAAEFRKRAKVFDDAIRRVLEHCDSNDAMEQELSKRRNGAGQ